MITLDHKTTFIFDMDGTLVNLELLNKEGYTNTIKSFFNLPLNNQDYQRYFSGTKTAKAFDDFLENVGITNYDVEELIKHFRTQKRKNLLSNFDNCVSLIPGSREYLKSLKENNKKIALATSTVKEFVDIIIKNLDIKEYFDVIITAQDITKGKPDPEIFELALEKLGGEKEEAVIFEDSKNGIDAALSSQMMCIGIHTKGLNDEWVNKADYVIEDYNSLI